MEKTKNALKKICLLLILTTLFIFILTLLKEYQTKNILGENDKNVSTDNQYVLKEIPLSVTCEKENNNVIPTSATFDLHFEETVEEEYIKKSIQVEPASEYQLQKINSKYYKLKTVEDLADGKIYNIIQTTQEGTKKWAFQTETTFKVKDYYPNETLYYKSTIELNFNVAPASNILEYITLEPKVDGIWRVTTSNTVRFEPTEEYKMGENYKVTVHKGAPSKYGDMELEEDFEISLRTDNIKIPTINIITANAYKKAEQVPIKLEYYINDENKLDLKDHAIKVIKLKNKEEFIKFLKEENNKEANKNLWFQEENETIFSKNITRENTKIEEITNYSLTSEIDLQIPVEGYYVILVKYNDEYLAKSLQINDATITCNVINENELFILAKDQNNNNIEVLWNGISIGKTDTDGVLYVDSLNKWRTEAQKLFKENPENFGYLEFKTSFPVILPVNGSIQNTDKDMSYIFNNGYLYTDREVYDVNETIHFWGFAKNRIKKVKNATLAISGAYGKIANIPLTLDENDCFSYDFLIEGINSGTFLYTTLYIDNDYASGKNLKVLDYSLKNYDIQISSDKNLYVAGDNAIIKIKATTYDGVPLQNLDFSYSFAPKEFAMQSGVVKTDSKGEAKINIPITLVNFTNNYLKVCDVKILNSLLDGEEEIISLNIYPYQNTVDTNARYIKDQNCYLLNFKEYDVLNKKLPKNNPVKILATAYKEERYIVRTYYDEYSKEMVDVYSTRDAWISSQYLTVEMQNGEGSIKIPNWSEDYETCKYKFNIYIAIDEARDIGISERYWMPEYESEDSKYESYIGELYKGYSLTIPKQTLHFGDKVEVAIVDEKGEEIKDYSNIEIYTYIISGKGREIIKSKNQNLEFTYTKEMGKNITLYSVIYDGNYAYSIMNEFYPKSITIEEKDVELTIELKFDKEIYKPGEEALITIETLNHGTPVSAEVNISAVDTSFIDLNGESNYQILQALYNDYWFYSTEISTHSFKGHEGGGGGGGDGEVRDSFFTTAFFEKAITDQNGKAKIKIKWPDNITNWTITSQAITNDFMAASKKQTVKVSKDFYVGLNHLDKYLENEKFGLTIKSFSSELNSEELKSNEKVSYTISLYNKNNEKIEEAKLEGNIGEIQTYIIKENLQKGKYKIKLEGTYLNKKDSLEKEIEIVENLLNVTYREDLNISEGEKILIQSDRGAIYIANKKVVKILDDLLELTSLKPNRSDSKEISKVAKEILNGLYRNQLKLNNNDYCYYGEDYLRINENANIDINLSLKILSIGKARYGVCNVQSLTDKIAELGSNEATLWAMANTGAPVLKALRDEKNKIMQEIQNTEGEIERKAEDVLYIALALADIGDDSSAQELYNEIKDKITIEDVSNYELLTMLAIKLNLPEREKLYAEYLKLEMPPENENFVKLYYIQNELNKNFEAGKLVCIINGKEQEIKVNNIGLTKLVVSNKDEIIIKEKSDFLAIMLEDKKPVDISKYESKNYILSKTYKKLGNDFGNLQQVTIKIDAKKLLEEQNIYFSVIEDVIPNNMTFVSIDNNERSLFRHKRRSKVKNKCLSILYSKET